MKYCKFISLILLAIMYGCSNDEPKLVPAPEPTPDPVPDIPIWDYYPAEVMIEVNDADGNNLFANEYHGILDKKNLHEDVSFTYKGETKPLVETGYRNEYFAKSRAVMTTVYGVYVHYSNPTHFPDALPRICFGEFDGTEDHNESVTINWPDGTHNKIEFTSEARNAIESMKVRVDDGQWVNTTKVTIVK